MAKTVLQVAVEQIDNLITQHTNELRKQVREALPGLVKGALGQVFGMENQAEPVKATATVKATGPKRRGRPPKALAEARAQAAAAAAAPKKRGRPPKVKVEAVEEALKKAAKRGRPAKSSLDAIHNQAMALTQPGVKRRGRPPGSKNKPKEPAVESDTPNGDVKKMNFQELKAQLEAGRKLGDEAIN